MPLYLAIHSLPPSGLLNATFTCRLCPVELIICTSFTPPPKFANVALMSSTETVGARFDRMTYALAVPAIEMDGIGGDGAA